MNLLNLPAEILEDIAKEVRVCPHPITMVTLIGSYR